MAPSRSTKSKYKRTPRPKDVSPHKEEESMSKTKPRVSSLFSFLFIQLGKLALGYMICDTCINYSAKYLILNKIVSLGFRTIPIFRCLLDF